MEEKQAPDPAPHLGLGHVESSDSVVVPSPSPRPEIWRQRLLPGTAVPIGPRHHPSSREGLGTPSPEWESIRPVSEASSEHINSERERNSLQWPSAHQVRSTEPCFMLSSARYGPRASAPSTPALRSRGPRQQLPHWSPTSHPGLLLQPEGSPKTL